MQAFDDWISTKDQAYIKDLLDLNEKYDGRNYW